MNRLSGIVVLLAFTACASAAPNEEAADRERVVVSSGTGAQMMDVTIQRDDNMQSMVVDASRAAVWRVLPAVYEAVGLPEPAGDESIWTVAVQNHTAMRRLGGVGMSRIVECGRGMTGEHADTHRIRLSVRTWLTPVGESTRVSTRVEAVAASVEGRGGTLSCSSRGDLERRILTELRSRVEGD